MTNYVNWSLDCNWTTLACWPCAQPVPRHTSDWDATSACSDSRTAFHSQAAHTSALDNWHSPTLSPRTCSTQQPHFTGADYTRHPPKYCMHTNEPDTSYPTKTEANPLSQQLMHNMHQATDTLIQQQVTRS